MDTFGHPLKLAVTLCCLSTVFILVRSTCTTDKRGFTQTYASLTEVHYLMFRDCVAASHINLSFNAIQEINNESFSILWNVENLDLSHNQIPEIPPSIFYSMRSLTYLNVSHNNLTTLPLDFFGNKPNLKKVDLSSNFITHISLHVFTKYNLPSIKEVDLSFNLLTSFEPWAFANTLTPIRVLNLTHNIISTFTNNDNWNYTSRSVYDLASTDLRWNQLVTWHDRYLMQYKTGPGTIEAALVELLTDFRENPIHCDCNFYNVNVVVGQSFYKYSDNPYLKLKCHSPPELAGKHIFIDVLERDLVCNITDNCPSGCLCQEQPAENRFYVDCRNLHLREMPNTLPETTYDKYVLRLDHNEITEFKNVSYLSKVVEITMANNSLAALPEYAMATIAKDDDADVDFRNNQIRTIPVSTQNIKFENALFDGNNLECSCDMLWMVDWINLAPNHADKSLSCTFEGKVHTISELDRGTLKCDDHSIIIIIVILSVALVIVIGLLITAKRCPYETKVLLYKMLRIHPSDKYLVDKITDMQYDMYVSFDSNDIHVRQWVKKILFKKLENEKPLYRLCTPIRDGQAGSEAESRIDLIDKSRRLLIILSRNYEHHRWNDYDLCHAERLEQNEGRVMFIVYDEESMKKSTEEPLCSKLKERKVFNVNDKMLWSKLRYELPVKPCKKTPTKTARERHQDKFDQDMYQV
ncbi:TOLL-like protein [Mya arenaria]|uniref:TOLL-like protein n=1 Tax=Mya arenaria TaxID=6604 RepID=A0ABY7DGD0_MYAAR|nr:toll-like receptor 2 [Mya arenaria]WAQ96354.1 TOLL-like protein [Mya arenaria]